MATMRNPEKWIGKRVEHLVWEQHMAHYDICDDCQQFNEASNLHALLYPQSAQDWKLQEALGVEEAQGFCPDCLAAIEAEADEIDEQWRQRHGID